jgi:putative restriction endonuclease
MRPLGAPHDGPDTSDNILCLCPNHHVFLDHGGVGIGEDLSLIGAEGRLHIHPATSNQRRPSALSPRALPS